jgi:hypothetical protein
MISRPVLLLRMEAAVVLTTSLLCYRELHGGWLLFATLFLVPDLSLAGYLPSVKVGAPVYNVIHTLIGPLALIGYSIIAAHSKLLLYGLIWIAHIGMDRALGFGLKYPTRFNDTHLQHV